MMNQPLNPNAFVAGNSEYRRLAVIRYLGFAGLTGAIIYEFSMIYGGLIATALLPPNLIFGSAVVAFAIAAIISSAVFVFYLCIPLMYPKFSWGLIVAIGVSLVLMGAFFSFFALTISAHGDDAVRGIRERIATARQNLVGIDDRITGTFVAQLAALEQSRRDACNGRDETGIKRCGPISTRYLLRSTNLRNAYAGLLSAPAIPTDVPVTSLGEGVGRVEAAADSLMPKIAAFARFGKDSGVVTGEVQTSYTAVAKRIAELRDSLPNGSPNTRDIVVQLTFRDLATLFTLAAAPAVYLRAIVAAFPAVLSLFFALALTAIDGTRSPERFEREIRAAKIKTYLAEKLASTQQNLSRALTKLWGARIQAEVADSALNGANKSR